MDLEIDMFTRISNICIYFFVVFFYLFSNEAQHKIDGQSIEGGCKKPDCIRLYQSYRKISHRRSVKVAPLKVYSAILERHSVRESMNALCAFLCSNAECRNHANARVNLICHYHYVFLLRLPWNCITSDERRTIPVSDRFKIEITNTNAKQIFRSSVAKFKTRSICLSIAWL